MENKEDTLLIMKSLLYLLRYSLTDYSGNHQKLDEELEARITQLQKPPDRRR